MLRCALLGSLALLAATPSLAHEYTGKGVTVAHPWVRVAPAGSTTTAAYLEIRGARGLTDRLTGAKAAVGAGVELHRTAIRNDVVTMEALDSIPIPAGRSVVLGPGGLHIMLTGLEAPLKEGELLKLTLLFEKAGPIEVEASIEPSGAKGPHGLDHQPGYAPAGKASGAAGAHGGHHKH